MGSKKTWLILAALLLLATLLVMAWRQAGPIAATSPARPPEVAPSSLSTDLEPAPTAVAAEGHQGYLYGRVTTQAGATYEGRLRWGGDEEAFWGNYLNGFKDKNPWAALVPPEQLPKEDRSIVIFGRELFHREREVDLRRPFMARLGDIERIDAGELDIRVRLKSGTEHPLDRFSAGDFDDGVRVWDAEHGVVDLGPWQILEITFLPTPRLATATHQLHGTVHTRHGAFTGFLQWNRQECTGADQLDGHTADGGELGVRFDTIRSIARQSRDSSLVTLLDGREIVLSGTREAGRGNLGVYVDDRRYGRVLVSWDAFERLDLTPADRSAAPGSGPAYGDFPPGRPLQGSVTTRTGRRLAGRLVYDLDESETTETLDAPSQGVDYTLPFGLIASIVLPDSEAPAAERARVTLRGGEELHLELTGDLGARNAGLLVFVDGHERPNYLPWAEVARIDLDPPPSPDSSTSEPTEIPPPVPDPEDDDPVLDQLVDDSIRSGDHFAVSSTGKLGNGPA